MPCWRESGSGRSNGGYSYLDGHGKEKKKKKKAKILWNALKKICLPILKILNFEALEVYTYSQIFLFFKLLPIVRQIKADNKYVKQTIGTHSTAICLGTFI